MKRRITRRNTRPIIRRIGPLLGLVLLLGIYSAHERGYLSFAPPSIPSSIAPATTAASDDAINDAQLAAAFATRQSDVQLRGRGRVVALLADDNEGSRHQRFLIETPAGHSLLIVHNIDLAARLDTLALGDWVEFYGEYEWNPKGGLVHWTHRDPRDRHAHGYLLHEGRRYE